MAEAMMTVEVVYARVDRQVLRSIEVPLGSTVRQTVLASGLGDEFPELDLAQCPVGIFGKVVADSRELHAGERVELYRPLLADPMEVRRLRAAKAAKARQDKEQS
jgi:putative ubiquitin-RnfH superfamily antitoxin RatB of RatAB toxin-antitoxin module